MGNQMKEDERIERAIQSLMKLPENRRCINCNNLGPQYICTTFFTFVCTNCSGIHREFTHRVKSVSMAKFTAEEVNALQAGGNERARQLYFRGSDLQRHSSLDGSNLYRLRELIKHVYVDRKYTRERSNTGRLTLGEKDEDNKSRKIDAHRYRSRGPYDEDKYERYSIERSSSFGKDDRRVKSYFDDIRSPRYSRENSRNVGHKRNPIRFEIVDDRFRDDRFGSRRFSLGDTASQRRLPNNNTNTESCSSPALRPLQEILGENFPTLRVGEISKENNGKKDNHPARNQESSIGKPVEHKNEISRSLIDFGTEIETPPDTSVVLQTQHSSIDTSTSLASVGSSTKQDSSQALKMKTLETLLFELSVPLVQPASDISDGPARNLLSTSPRDDVHVAAALPALTQQMPELVNSIATTAKQSSNNDLLQANSSDDTTVKATNELPFENVQQPLLSLSITAGSSSFSQTAAVPSATTTAYLEPSFSSLAHSDYGSKSVGVEQSSQFILRPVQDTITGVERQALPEETKSSNRKEFPADLFTINTGYISVAAPVSGWQTGPPRGMSFNYFPNTLSVPALPFAAKSTNPFDISDERSQFPSVASLQGALPNAPTGLLHTSSIGPYSSQLIGPQYSANAQLMPPQLPFIGSAFTPSPCAYMGQEVHNNIQHSQPQGLGGFGSNGAVFGSINTTQQPASTYSAPATPNPSSMGGNPFG